MMYLYVGSIVAIMCIYISVLIDNCPSLTNSNGSRENLTTNKGDPEVGSIASFGTLRKAHIDRTKVSRTSFYLRVGALGKYSSVDEITWSRKTADFAILSIVIFIFHN